MQETTPQKRPLLMTVDFEDYRRQQLRDHLGTEPAANAAEVERQLEMLLSLLHDCGGQATFFSVGRLTKDLSVESWNALTSRHRIGSHGQEHVRVDQFGAARLREELRQSKEALEDKTGRAVKSFRAPYFSVDGCNPWFGEALAETGYRIDSSTRCASGGAGFQGTMILPGSGDRVSTVPLMSAGFGGKRITVIGGTYFRWFPLPVIRKFLHQAEARGFFPIIYLHPYDIDPTAAPLAYPAGHAKHKLGDWMRRQGRGSAAAKLKALAAEYEFHAVESLLESPARPSIAGMPLVTSPLWLGATGR